MAVYQLAPKLPAPPEAYCGASETKAPKIKTLSVLRRRLSYPDTEGFGSYIPSRFISVAGIFKAANDEVGNYGDSAFNMRKYLVAL